MVLLDKVINRSTKGSCTNYLPDRTRPDEVKARDVPGLELYACQNYCPTDLGREMGGACGNVILCSKYVPKEGIYVPQKRG